MTTSHSKTENQTKIRQMVAFIAAGHTYKEASEVFDVPSGSIGSHMKRAGYTRDADGRWISPIKPAQSARPQQTPVTVYKLTPEEIEARYGKPGKLAEKAPLMAEHIHIDEAQREERKMNIAELTKEDEAEANYIDPDWGFVPDPVIENQVVQEPMETPMTFCDMARKKHDADCQAYKIVMSEVTDAICHGKKLSLKSLFAYERLRWKYCR